MDWKTCDFVRLESRKSCRQEEVFGWLALCRCHGEWRWLVKSFVIDQLPIPYTNTNTKTQTQIQIQKHKYNCLALKFLLLTFIYIKNVLPQPRSESMMIISVWKELGELMMIVMMVTIIIIMSIGVKGIVMIDDHLQRMRRFSTSATSIRTKWVNFRNLQFRRWSDQNNDAGDDDAEKGGG